MAFLKSFILLLALFSFSAFYSLAQNDSKGMTVDLIGEANILNQNSFKEIEQVVKENTPNFLFKPIYFVFGKLESFRQGIFLKTESRRQKVESFVFEEAIKRYEETNGSKEKEVNDSESSLQPSQIYKIGFSEIAKGFKHLEIFLLVMILFILSGPLIFYSIVIIVLVFLGRFLWYRIY